MNRVNLVGRLTAKPELRYTGTQVAVTRFTVAINRTFTNAQGEREADFISITAWRRQAENVVNYLDKGSLVGIDGRIQTGNYVDKDGKTVYTTDVVADNVEFLESRNQAANQGGSFSSNNQQPQQDNTQASNSSSPYDFQENNVSVADDPFADFGDSVSLDDADLD